MKRKAILTSALLSAGIIFLSSYKDGPAHGSLGNRTGSTGSANSCSMGGCHPSESSSLLITLTLTDNATSAIVTDGKYEPGHEYTVKLSGAYSGGSSYSHLGFQASVVNGASGNSGTITATEAGTETIAAGGVTLIEHTNPLSKSGDTYDVTFRWTAPATGSGDAKFYIRMLANNNNNNSSDDTPNRLQVTYAEAGATSLTDLDKTVVTHVYPNPAGGLLNISMAQAPVGNYSFMVSDLTGKRLVTESHTITGSNMQQVMDINNLPGGAYLLSISNGKQVRILKFIKK